MWYWPTSAGVIEVISGWVICPTFSSSVMSASNCLTRASTFLSSSTLFSTRGQSESCGSDAWMCAHPSSSSLGLPTTGWAGCGLPAPLAIGTSAPITQSAVTRTTSVRPGCPAI